MLAFCTVAVVHGQRAAGQAKSPRFVAVTVTDTAGLAQAEALVMISGTALRATTDVRGRATIRNVDWGPQEIIVRKVGFREVTERVVVPAGGSASVTVKIERVTVDLATLVVRDKGAKPARLDGTSRLDEFYRRRAEGGGTFITREDIDKRNPQRTIDLFMGIAGIRLTYRGSTPLLSFARCKQGVEVFIDGQRLNDGITEITGLHPNQIEAIEIYHGLASVPPQFVPKPDDCAAILIWTRYN